MKSGTKAKYLVVDTSGFIKNVQFHELAENVITVDDVVKEITCHKQLKRLAVLPYDLTIKSAFPENIATVSEFAKKTGDYLSLSAVDMKVMALTYQLEKEHVGTDHINTTPKLQTSIEDYNPCNVSFDNVAGFYHKDKSKESNVEALGVEESVIERIQQLEVSDEIKDTPDESSHVKPEETVNRTSHDQGNDASLSTVSECSKNCDQVEHTPSTEKLDSEISKKIMSSSESDESLKNPGGSILIRNSKVTDETDDLTPSPTDDKIETGYSSDDEGDSLSEDIALDDSSDAFKPSDDLMILKRIDQQTLDCDEISDDDSIYDDDEYGWITPTNINQAKKESVSGLFSDETVTVACITTDFAMQNVLLQMGLNVMAIDGRIIKQVRTYILRCHACGKTTSIMTKIFCPKCGLKTLKKVAVSIDPDGKQQIFINYRKQITARGKRWSIPRPQGGKHANNPILVEDQRIPQQRLSKKAMQRTNALDPDYIAGFSPFVMKDTTSKSVMLGFHTCRQNVKHLVGRNPNVKKTGKRKK